MVSTPKRHHQVPRFYLDRFASDRRLAVRWRDGKAFETSPLNVAVESGFYDIPDGAGGTSKEVETGLSHIEGLADAALRLIDIDGRPPGEADPVRATLALFIALQVTRTTDHRERVLFPRRVLDWAGTRSLTRELVAEYLETQHLGFEPDPREVDGAFTVVGVAARDAPETLTDEFAVEMMLRSTYEIAPRLLGLNWTVEVDPARGFITSDRPVLPWRKPGPRDDVEGFGVANATEVRFPLDPGKQLVLSQRRRAPTENVAAHRVRKSNADLAGACHRFLIGTPDRRAPLDAQHLDPRGPVIRFMVGPLFVEGRNGPERQPGDVVQMWTPRWSGLGRPKSLRS